MPRQIQPGRLLRRRRVSRYFRSPDDVTIIAADAASVGERARASAYSVAERSVRAAASHRADAAVGQAEQDPDCAPGHSLHRLPVLHAAIPPATRTCTLRRRTAVDAAHPATNDVRRSSTVTGAERCCGLRPSVFSVIVVVVVIVTPICSHFSFTIICQRLSSSVNLAAVFNSSGPATWTVTTFLNILLTRYLFCRPRCSHDKWIMYYDNC